MKEDSKKNNILTYIVLVVFMTYTAIFMMVNMGYYEYSNYTKKVFTEEKIKEFEKDIKDGKNLDIDKYLVVKEDYSQKRQIGRSISEFIGRCSRKGIEEIFKLLNKVVES